ncbi:MAG: ABC transporter permease [bacterium]|nr:ABC transporter permease [bacterium]
MNNLHSIIKKEVKEVFRDKKSLFMMLITPILAPLFIIGISTVYDLKLNKSVEDYNKIGFNYKLSEIEKNIAKEYNIEILEKNNEELKIAYDNDEIDLYVIKDGNNIELNGYMDETTSYAMGLVSNFYMTYKEHLQSEYLIINNINPDAFLNVFTIDQNISNEENDLAFTIIFNGFMFIIMAITTSATYPATDTTAGEKERGTLETLLTFPIKSRDIILGKFLSVSFVSIIIGVISLLLMLISLVVANNIFDVFKDVNLMLSSNNILLSLLIIIIYSFFISGLCISIASKSKSFKGAQSALAPVSIISFFPGIIISMMNIKTTLVFSLIPFLNIYSLFNDIVKGNVNVIYICLTIISTFIFTILLLTIIIREYKSENVLF